MVYTIQEVAALADIGVQRARYLADERFLKPNAEARDASLGRAQRFAPVEAQIAAFFVQAPDLLPSQQSTGLLVHLLRACLAQFIEGKGRWVIVIVRAWSGSVKKFDLGITDGSRKIWEAGPESLAISVIQLNACGDIVIPQDSKVAPGVEPLAHIVLAPYHAVLSCLSEESARKRLAELSD